VREEFRFFYSLRVRYSEIDGQGIVFNAHYLTYLDTAFIEYLRHLGFDYATMAKENLLDYALVKSTLEFKASGYFDDILDIGVRVGEIRNSSFTVLFEIHRNRDLLLRAENICACYNAAERRSEPVPAFFRDAVSRFEGL
jgi:acyl-CoA thioester hydrolase